MKVTANVLPKVTEGTENKTMFAAVYSVDNGVTNIRGISEIKSEQVSAGSYKTFSLTLNAPDDFNSQNYFIKIFLWDTIQSAVPSMKPIIVTK